MGLQKAMYRFIVNNGEDNESVDIDDMEIPEDSLDFKLYNLMKKKKIRELNIDNMDEVIYSISDKVIEIHYGACEHCKITSANLPNKLKRIGVN